MGQHIVHPWFFQILQVFTHGNAKFMLMYNIVVAGEDDKYQTRMR